MSKGNIVLLQMLIVEQHVKYNVTITYGTHEKKQKKLDEM